jgi:heparan-sulfate lyase
MLTILGPMRSLLRAVALAALLILSSGGVPPFCTTGSTAMAASEASSELRSMKPEEILALLDLEQPGLAAVKAAAEQGKRSEALAALLTYYREKYPLRKPSGAANEANTKRADNIVSHIFQWGPYESAQYEEDVRWDWDPRGDIEWVAAVYRFHWADPLSHAFANTRDEKYGKAFVDLTRDWIAKHPLEEHKKTHYVYEHWRGFAWLDIQTGIRATRLCRTFPTLVHAEAFTPEFLAIFLASMYDHQVKTERLPMGVVHNKAVFEQRGFVNIAYTFPEFRDTQRWMTLAMGRLRENFLAQVTPDGVQREWSGGYHSGVLSDAVEVMGRMETFNVPVPDDFRQRVRGMYDYILGIASPELGYPMFGDTSRAVGMPAKRSQWQLHSDLMQGTKVSGDPKYAARATLDPAALPAQTCYAFRDAGMYALRDTWGPDQIYFPLHCSPPALTGHDQPDNGTFELCAYGRWLMNDSGYYTYGHDKKARAWHRQTRVHQTLTLDGKDTKVAGKGLLWHTAPDFAALAVENASYANLTHRRTVWFVDKRFFVLLDEAIGDATGALDLHFQFAPGEVESSPDTHQARTQFEDVNLLVWQDPDAPVTLHEEDGWFAWKYGHRTPRTAIRFRHNGAAPSAFLTVLVPYRGTEPPKVSIDLPQNYSAGAGRVEFHVQAFGQTYTLGRDFAEQTAWCAKAE